MNLHLLGVSCRHVVACRGLRGCLLHLRAETGFLHLKKPIHHCPLSTETVKSQSVGLDFYICSFIIVIFLYQMFVLISSPIECNFISTANFGETHLEKLEDSVVCWCLA